MAIQLLAAFLGSLGFATLFHVPRKKLLPAALGGFLTWGTYLLFRPIVGDELVANLLGAALGTCYAEILARLFKAPATVFIIPAIIPMVPGGSLYYTMYSIVTGDHEGISHYGSLTGNAALGVALGIICVSSIFTVIVTLRRRQKELAEHKEDAAP